MISISVPRRLADIILYTLFLVVTVLGYSVTGSFPSPFLPGYPGSAMFPRLVLIVMGVICLSGLIRTLLTSRTEKPARDAVELELGGFLAIVCALLAFALVLAFVGMEVAVFLFIAGGLYFRNRKAGQAIASGALAVIVVYVLFVQALSVHLPLTFLPRYLGLGI